MTLCQKLARLAERADRLIAAIEAVERAPSVRAFVREHLADPPA